MKHTIAIEDAAARCPGAIVLELPAKLPPGPSAWSSLYEWIVATTGTARADLHNRTVAGRDAMRELRAEERRRLKARDPRDVTARLRWSDLNSGPQVFVDGARLEGRWLLVRP